jgi:hypothetical protein
LSISLSQFSSSYSTIVISSVSSTSSIIAISSSPSSWGYFSANIFANVVLIFFSSSSLE